MKSPDHQITRLPNHRSLRDDDVSAEGRELDRSAAVLVGAAERRALREVDADAARINLLAALFVSGFVLDWQVRSDLAAERIGLHVESRVPTERETDVARVRFQFVPAVPLQ